MRYLLRILFFFMIISAGLSLIRGLFNALTSSRLKTGPARQAAGPAGPARAVAGRLVKDPVCGTHIPEQGALRAGDNFFCSETCRGEFVSRG